MQLTLDDLYKIKGTILLLGETGTGKSYLAQQIYHKRAKNEGPFYTCHLSTLNENLLESELFGHAKGSFTGAVNDKIGQVEYVGQGTLFLDEIGELSPQSQKKLLWLLEERCYRPVGALAHKRFHGCVIAATSHPLEKLVQERLFRQDLFERLKLFCYKIPPLRETPNRLTLLLDEFLKEENLRLSPKKTPFFFTQKAQEILHSYSWPGNVREVRHAVEYAVAISKTSAIDENALPEWMEDV